MFVRQNHFLELMFSKAHRFVQPQEVWFNPAQLQFRFDLSLLEIRWAGISILSFCLPQKNCKNVYVQLPLYTADPQALFMLLLQFSFLVSIKYWFRRRKLLHINRLVLCRLTSHLAKCSSKTDIFRFHWITLLARIISYISSTLRLYHHQPPLFKTLLRWGHMNGSGINTFPACKEIQSKE